MFIRAKSNLIVRKHQEHFSVPLHYDFNAFRKLIYKFVGLH